MPLRELNEVICGPRCVQFVLKQYGRAEPLDALVREMQWPDLSKKSSVRQIEKALESRSVYTRSIQLKNTRRFEPRCPAVVHLCRGHGGGEGSGHFVVVMPRSTPLEVVFWDGLFGLRRERWADFSKQMTGVVVLTGDSPINDVDAATRLHASCSRWMWILSLSAVLALGIVFLIPFGAGLLRAFATGTSSLVREKLR
ncbi:MAG: cysteine peptidase family C39 domain-containing protein [Planctomycetota bacterium]